MPLQARLISSTFLGLSSGLLGLGRMIRHQHPFIKVSTVVEPFDVQLHLGVQNPELSQCFIKSSLYRLLQNIVGLLMSKPFRGQSLLSVFFLSN